MTRAASVLTVLLVTAASLAIAQERAVEGLPDIIDGSGMVDFSKRPGFTVGSWVKYRTTGSSLQGHQDDYTVTLLVGGEEVFWGDPGVWIETWVEKPGMHLTPIASLISYSAFGDTLASKRILWFIRKTIHGLLPDGSPDITLSTRGEAELKLRKANWEKDEEIQTKIDTLEAGTATVPAGTFDVKRLRRVRGHAETAERGDSTVFYQRRYNQIFHLSDKVPITSLVKIEIDDTQEGKTWLAGQSDKRPLQVLERAQGSTVLLEFGTGGLAPKLVPERSRKSIADRKLVEQALNMPMEPIVKPLTGGAR